MYTLTGRAVCRSGAAARRGNTCTTTTTTTTTTKTNTKTTTTTNDTSNRNDDYNHTLYRKQYQTTRCGIARYYRRR